MGRGFGGYDLVTYELWKQGTGRSNPRCQFGVLFDAYSEEAADQLDFVLSEMKKRWGKNAQPVISAGAYPVAGFAAERMIAASSVAEL